MASKRGTAKSTAKSSAPAEDAAVDAVPPQTMPTIPVGAGVSPELIRTIRT
jgi:hypothetical protein